MTENTASRKTIVNMARPEGTVLRDRYVIKKYVGYGGFSIVYDAQDSLTGKRVAVKECTNDEFNEKFLQEARLLAGFSDEPAIVSVIDSFIEDGTAFIVMEFLEGKTLRETVKDDGVWSMEDTLHRLSDVMKTVEHINTNGVIHRDISPDNLMVMPDGSVKLLDFGAAREFEKVTVSKLVYKPNFSPPEQVDEKGTMGAWSDVYSMCATMYYCITGDNPEDVISRLLFDELKLPSEYGADIQPEAEKLLMKGLELESEKRIQNMGILRSGLEEIYRVLTEEELAAIAAEKRRRLIRRLSIAAGILLVIAAVLYIFRMNIYFLFNESDTLTLDGSEMTEAEYKQSSAIVKDRFKAFTDGYYLWKDKDGKIDVTIPHKLTETCVPEYSDLATYVKHNILYATMSEVWLADSFTLVEEMPAEDRLADLDHTKDIKWVKKEGDAIRVVFTEEGAAKLRDVLKTEDTRLFIPLYVTDDGVMIDSFEYQDIRTTGDGKSVIIGKPSYAEGEVPFKLKKNILLGNIPEKCFKLEQSLVAITDWENPGKASAPGKYQVKESDLANKAGSSSQVFIRYSSYSDHDFADMKKVLDATEVPYAIGSVKGSEDICVEVAADKVGLEVLKLTNVRYPPICFSDGKRRYDVSTYSDRPTFRKDEDGNYTVDIRTVDSEEYQKAVNGILNKIEESGSEYVYLRYSSFDIARLSIKEAREMLDKDRHIVFSEWCATDEGKDYIPQFCEFVSIADTALPMCSLVAVQPKDTDATSPFENTPRIFKSEEELYDFWDELEKQYEGNLTFDYTTDQFSGKEGYTRAISVWSKEAEELSIEENTSRFSKFFGEKEAELKKHGVDRVSLIVGSKGSLLSLQLFEDSDEYQITDLPGGFTMFTSEEIKAAKAAVKKDPVLGPLKTKETSE